MLNIDFSASLRAKEDINLNDLRTDLGILTAKYGRSTRISVEFYYSDDEELKRLSAEEFDSLKESVSKGELPKPVAKEEPVTQEAPAPVVKEEPTVNEEPKDEIDLPEFPARETVTKEDLRSLLRAIKDASTDNLGLRNVYANAGKEGKTFSSLAAEEYTVMYQEGRKILWQLTRS